MPLEESVLRSFYDTEYHFAEDVEQPDLARLWRVLRHIAPLAGTDFLDLGCGVGWGAHLALTRGGAARAIGMDFSSRALQLGRRAVPGVLWLQADGSRLPLADGSVNRVLSFGSLEHFPDVPAALREVHRVLRPDGRAVIVVPNLYVRTEQPQERRDHYFGWKRELHAAGLRVTRTGADRGPRLFAGGSPLRVAKRLAGRAASLVPGLQYQFVFVASRA